MEESSGTGLSVRGIRCRIGKAEIALELDEVGQIIEYPVFPLPLARRWIGGLGVYEGRPLLSIALARAPQRTRVGQRVTRGILLEGRGGSEVDWALEVDGLGSFVQAAISARPAPEGIELPAWIGQARDGEGNTIGWLDVPAMLADLASEEPHP
jgi:chemotaxis signal transduction protein